MKTVLTMILGALFLVSQAGMAGAVQFDVAASIPLAAGVKMTLNSVDSVTNEFTKQIGASSTALTFNPMIFVPGEHNDINIWLPNHYFALDIAPDGAGTPDVTLKYTEGVNPNLADGKHGLGWKTVATFKRMTFQLPKNKEDDLSKKLLKDINNEHILASDIGTGSWLRVYFGIVTGDPTANEPAGSEVFSNGDRPGAYDGALVITASVV